MKKMLRAILALLLLSLMAIFFLSFLANRAYLKWQSDQITRGIPEEIAVGEVIEISIESPFWDACGAAVFKLPSETQREISAVGIEALEKIRRRAARRIYVDWLETPYHSEIYGESLSARSLGGIVCGKINPKLDRLIFNSWRAKGSYYLYNDDSAWIVIPAAGIMVYTFY